MTVLRSRNVPSPRLLQIEAAGGVAERLIKSSVPLPSRSPAPKTRPPFRSPEKWCTGYVTIRPNLHRWLAHGTSAAPESDAAVPPPQWTERGARSGHTPPPGPRMLPTQRFGHVTSRNVPSRRHHATARRMKRAAWRDHEVAPAHDPRGADRRRRSPLASGPSSSTRRAPWRSVSTVPRGSPRTPSDDATATTRSHGERTGTLYSRQNSYRMLQPASMRRSTHTKQSRHRTLPRDNYKLPASSNRHIESSDRKPASLRNRRACTNSTAATEGSPSRSWRAPTPPCRTRSGFHRDNGHQCTVQNKRCTGLADPGSSACIARRRRQGPRTRD